MGRRLSLILPKPSGYGFLAGQIGRFSIFRLGGVTLSHSNLVCNVVDMLDSQNLLIEKVEGVAKRSFAQLYLMHQLSLFLIEEVLYGHSGWTIIMHSAWVPLETKRQLVQNPELDMSHICSMSYTKLPVTFRIQFKILFITYKAFMKPGYLQDCLSSMISAFLKYQAVSVWF